MRMKMKTMAPRGNWNRIEASVDQLSYFWSGRTRRQLVNFGASAYPNVDTISGPKPATAPLTVYLG